MTRSLFIAPQWIGDAVMTEPLLRQLHARGELVAADAGVEALITLAGRRVPVTASLKPLYDPDSSRIRA